MANQITGKIIALGSPRYFDANDQSKGYSREVVLDCSRYDQETGRKFDNFPSVEVTSKAILSMPTLEVGQKVRFDFAIEGRYYQRKDGNGRAHFNSIRAYKAEVLEHKGQAQQMQQAPQAAPLFPPVEEESGVPF